jgi:glycosyltransferase involved in cell wall biosynthesis
VITVHDLYFLKSPDETQKASVDLFRKRIKQHLDSADGIIAASRSTASDIIDIFKTPYERINVVYHGADHVRKISDEEKEGVRAEIRKKMGIPLTAIILLFVGTIEPRKNPVLLLKAYNRLMDKYKKDLYLVYGGDMGWGRDEFLYELNGSSYRDSIYITGYLNRSELDRLYTIADIFILPSNYEGFGFPLLEAMRCGIPAIAANNSSLPEIGADAALYFETRNVDSLIEKIELLLGDNNLADDLSRRGKMRSALFTWEKTAAETVKVYESI